MLTFRYLGNYGRFGNQMFQAASTIGVAIKNEQPYGFHKWVNPFGLELPKVDGVEFRDKNIPWGYHDIKLNKGNHSLHGYLQSERYFEHCADRIRQMFTFKYKIEAPNFISVHVRRGDYLPQYYNILGKDYYDHALRLLPDLPVYVFTDDPVEAKKVVPSYDQLFYNDAFCDLNMMSRAKYSIIANSSFSWWGAWLADSVTIAPKHWFGPGLKHYSTKDLIPHRWEQI